MKTMLKLFIVLSLLLAGFLQASPARAADILKVKGPGADAFFYSTDGCVETTVSLYSRDEMLKSPYDKYKESFAYVSIFQYDTCTQTTIMFADGFTWIGRADLQVSKNLNQATLNTTVTVYEYYSGTWFDVNIDMTWTATGPGTSESNKYKFRAPGCRYQSQSKGMFRPAEAYGSITDGSTNFTPVTGVGTLFDAQFMEKIVGCN